MAAAAAGSAYFENDLSPALEASFALIEKVAPYAFHHSDSSRRSLEPTI